MPVSIFDNDGIKKRMTSEFRLRFEDERDPNVSLNTISAERLDGLEAAFSSVAAFLSALLSSIEDYLVPLTDPGEYTKNLDAVELGEFVFSYQVPLVIMASKFATSLAKMDQFLQGLAIQVSKLVSGSVQATMDAIQSVMDFIKDFISKNVGGGDDMGVEGIAAAVLKFFEPMIETIEGLLRVILEMLAYIAAVPTKMGTWLLTQEGILASKIQGINVKFQHRPDIAAIEINTLNINHNKKVAKRRKIDTKYIATLNARIASSIEQALAMSLLLINKPIEFIVGVVRAVVSFVKELIASIITAIPKIILEGESVLDVVMEPVEIVVDAMLGVFDKLLDFSSLRSSSNLGIISQRSKIASIKLEITDISGKISKSTGIVKERLIAKKEKLGVKLGGAIEDLDVLLVKADLIQTAPVEAIQGAVVCLLTGVIAGVGIPIEL